MKSKADTKGLASKLIYSSWRRILAYDRKILELEPNNVQRQ